MATEVVATKITAWTLQDQPKPAAFHSFTASS
jgi:hypothetical protein